MDNQKTILVCPLDWGLGHATRCIPIIQSFINQNCKVIIGTSGKQEALLRKEFPNLHFIELKGYDVEYSKGDSMVSKMITQLPKIKKAIKKEHDWLEKIINEYKVDMVISDNRYGLWNKKVKSVLITHQLFIKAPTGEWLIEKIVKSYLDNFNEIWIPDVEGEHNLSGDLSHKKPLPNNYKFIGVLSRFSNHFVTSSVPPLCGTYREDNFEYDFIAILSGPEPQRTIFENLILKQVENSILKGVLVRGLPDEHVIANCEERNRKQSARINEIASSVSLPRNDEKLKIFNHLETTELLHFIQKSKVVISRSGYSTMMDLAVMGKKAILVPTSGQTEQEYLAKYHHEKGHFYSQKQNEFDLEKGLKELENYEGIKFSANFLVSTSVFT